MGLMYPFPIRAEETDFVWQSSDKKIITIKSYGLPYIFWLYAFAALLVYGFMILGIWGTLLTLLNSGDTINQVLGICFILFCTSLPVSLFCFFFYQKTVTANHALLTLMIKHKVAGITFRSLKITFDHKIKLELEHFLDSPNMARMQGSEQMRGFKNKGYFLLEAISHKKRILIDRSSNKADLGKIKNLLESVNI